MRANGQLYAEIRTEGGLNEWGEPIGDTTQWAETPIECSIVPNSDNRMGKYEDGEFRQASYVVLIEAQPFSAERIRLVRSGEALGEFRLISVRELSLGRVQIIV